MQFPEVAAFCFKTIDCTTAKYKENKTLAQYLRGRRDRVAPLLQQVYERIARQAPNADVLVLGYPHLFPATVAEQDCPKLEQVILDGKHGITVGFTNAEQNLLREETAKFNQTIADRVNRSKVATFVPVDDRFAGYEVCGSKGEWINAPQVARNGKVNTQSLHPNEFGHELGYAAAVNALYALPEF